MKNSQEIKQGMVRVAGIVARTAFDVARRDTRLFKVHQLTLQRKAARTEDPGARPPPMEEGRAVDLTDS